MPLLTSYRLSPLLLGVTVASALLGTILGAMFAGIPGDRLGRRDSLRVMAVLYLVSRRWAAPSPGTGIRWCSSVSSAGWASAALPCSGPCTSPKFRRPSGAGGWWASSSSTWCREFCWRIFPITCSGTAGLGAAEWRWKLGVAALPAVLFFVMLFGIPRSPRWLVQKRRVPEARAGACSASARRTSTRELPGNRRLHRRRARPRPEPLFSRKYRVPIFLAVSIAMFNQLSGINAILYYLNDIFAKAGFSKVSGDLQAVAIGATNLLFTIDRHVGDRQGRAQGSCCWSGRVGTAACLGGVAYVFSTRAARRAPGVAAGGLHRVLRVLARRGHLGLPERSLSQPRARPGPEPGQLHALGHERADLLRSSRSLAAKSGASPFVFFSAMMVVQFFVVLHAIPRPRASRSKQMQKKLGIV